jgi:S-adenosyl-L-methionine hydrolase (adenosine-forming)
MAAAEALEGIAGAVSLTNTDYHIHPVSSTFHGRDVFAPAAAHLASGLEMERLGEAVDPASLARVKVLGMEKEDTNTIAATIVGVDRYGNARLSVAADETTFGFGALLKVDADVDDDIPIRYVETFGHSKVGDLVLVPDSHRRLSLSVNQGNASRALALEVGDRVRLTLFENEPESDRSQDATP